MRYAIKSDAFRGINYQPIAASAVLSQAAQLCRDLDGRRAIAFGGATLSPMRHFDPSRLSAVHFNLVYGIRRLLSRT